MLDAVMPELPAHNCRILTPTYTAAVPRDECPLTPPWHSWSTWRAATATSRWRGFLPRGWSASSRWRWISTASSRWRGAASTPSRWRGISAAPSRGRGVSAAPSRGRGVPTIPSWIRVVVVWWPTAVRRLRLFDVRVTSTWLRGHPIVMVLWREMSWIHIPLRSKGYRMPKPGRNCIRVWLCHPQRPYIDVTHQVLKPCATVPHSVYRQMSLHSLHTFESIDTRPSLLVRWCWLCRWPTILGPSESVVRRTLCHILSFWDAN